MKNFLKIGEFAALSGISRKLLIFYDNNDILHPKYIDPENGYRYYSYRQIETANVIVSVSGGGNVVGAYSPVSSGKIPGAFAKNT